MVKILCDRVDCEYNSVNAPHECEGEPECLLGILIIKDGKCNCYRKARSKSSDR